MDVLIEKAKKELETELEVIEEVSFEGEPILKIKKNDKSVYLCGKRNNIEPARLWVKNLGKLQSMAPVLIMGTGNPFYLKELVEQTENRITIIVYEPSLPIFLKFLEMVDLERWMEKHLIIFWVNGLPGMEIGQMRGVLEQVLKYETLNFSRHFILPNYDILFADQAVEFIKMCRDIAMEEVLQFNTRNAFSKITVKNLFANAKYLVDGYKITQLPEVIPRDIPCILVAAGPSLNKNIQELKNAKGRAFIVAVDTAIKPLLQADIVPDMFAIVDAEKPLDLVKAEEARSIPLLTTLNAAPEVLEYHTGIKFFWDEGYQFAERIILKSGQMVGSLSSGGSVATVVFSFFHKIGMETIILVGQDLAYTDNKSHADGTFQEIMEQHDTSGFLMVEGNYEEKVPTRHDFRNFISWYNKYIEGCQNQNERFRVINATEGGAKIEHTEIMALKDAIEQVCVREIDIQKCLYKLPTMLNQEAKIWAKEYLRGIPQEYGKLKADAGKMKKLYKKLDKICERRNIDKGEYLHLLKRLKKLSTDMDASSTYQLIAITLSSAQYIMGNEQFVVEDTIQEEGKEIARKGVLYTENVMKMADLFRKMAEEEFSKLI